MQHPKELNIGDIVYHKYYGIGQIEDIDKDLGNGGSDYHYWWSYAEDLKLISSVRTLIERRQHG